MLQHHDYRPIPKWVVAALPKWLKPHWIWIYIDIRGANECWPWTGANRIEGYGRFRYAGKARLAHRVVYAIQNKIDLVEFEKTQLLVRHTCDNPICCNPKHLVPGTIADNMKDRHERGRYAQMRGEENGSARLKIRQVLSIKRQAQRGLKRGDVKALAKKYGVANQTISAIVTGHTWDWLQSAN